MGYMSALSMAQATDLDTALGWHLSANHYPPLPGEMVPVAKLAIEAAIADEPDREIDLPLGVEWRDQPKAPAWALIEHMHLEAFIDAAREE